MSGGPELNSDLPFDLEVVDYIARRLVALGVRPDRQWLRDRASDVRDLLLTIHGEYVEPARKHIPQSGADWETCDFYRWAVPLATFDLRMGRLTTFEEFEFLYLRILGEDARPWLPSLFLVALASPSLVADWRIRLFRSFDDDHLKIEENAELRAIRLHDDDE